MNGDHQVYNNGLWDLNEVLSDLQRSAYTLIEGSIIDWLWWFKVLSRGYVNKEEKRDETLNSLVRLQYAL